MVVGTANASYRFCRVFCTQPGRGTRSGANLPNMARALPRASLGFLLSAAATEARSENAPPT
eukprot:11189359-Lingulodinium_polyedra.AAC.1